MIQPPLHGRLGRGEETYLEALSDLIAAYEDEHHAIEPASDADMLRHLMEARGGNQVQLHRETSVANSTISALLVGKRPLSRGIIRKLADYFNVDVSVLAGNLATVDTRPPGPDAGGWYWSRRFPPAP